MSKKPPPQGYEFMGRKLGPKKLKRPVAGSDTRPTERETMSGMPRKRKPMPKPDSRMKMPKELESIYPKRNPSTTMPRMPKGMYKDMPRTSKTLPRLGKVQPKNRPRKAQPRQGY